MVSDKVADALVLAWSVTVKSERSTERGRGRTGEDTIGREEQALWDR